MPEIEYPSPFAGLAELGYSSQLRVKNTFIDTVSCQASFLDGSSVFSQRQVQSCPGSRLAPAANEAFFGSFASCCEGDGEPPTPGSRSTSASPGLSAATSAAGDDAAPAPAREDDRGLPCRPASEDLPDFEYPAPAFAVRNTFIDTKVGRPLSMVDDFFEERRIQSCPTSRIAAPPGLEEDSEMFVPRRTDGEARLGDGSLFVAAAADAGEDWWPLGYGVPESPPIPGEQGPPLTTAPLRGYAVLQSFPSVGEQWAALVSPFATAAPLDAWGATGLPSPADVGEKWAAFVPPPPPPHVSSPGSHAATEANIALATAMPLVSSFANDSAVLPMLPVTMELHAAIGTPECPTLGSQYHGLGNCRPCAHAHKGCANGAACPFCHLCDAGELKRRQKERRALQHRERGGERGVRERCGRGARGAQKASGGAEAQGASAREEMRA